MEFDAIVDNTTLANGVYSRHLNFRRDFLLGLPEFVSKCAGEAIILATTLTAPGTIYLWRDENGNVLSDEVSVDVVFPGVYTLDVTTSDGCAMSAQIEVVDDVIPEIFPNDVLLECGTTQALDGGMGFASYQWSTGETGQFIDISAPGTLSLIVTTVEGCISEGGLV